MFSFQPQIAKAGDPLPGRSESMAITDRHYVNGKNLKPPFEAGTHQAVFGLGCFWGAERCFWQLDGVITTAVGYAGGSTPNPTYHEVCSGRTGHTEAVLVVFDPARISYEKLLQRAASSAWEKERCFRLSTRHPDEFLPGLLFQLRRYGRWHVAGCKSV